MVMGLGIGPVMPNLPTAIQNGVARSELGWATATAFCFRSLGGALGVALAGAVLAMHIGAIISPARAGLAPISSWKMSAEPAVEGLTRCWPPRSR